MGLAKLNTNKSRITKSISAAGNKTAQTYFNTKDEIKQMTKAELEAKIEDLTNAIDCLFSKLGMPSWNAHKRQARANEELRAHESHLASGVRG
jgi:hypothetical protein